MNPKLMSHLKTSGMWSVLALGFGCVVVIMNLWAITGLTSWFDESFMADIAYSLGHGDGYKATIMPQYQGDILVYGPVFFWVQQVVIALFGFTEFSSRITGLASGVGVAVVVPALVYMESRSFKCALITFVLLIGDVSFNRSMASGRMDLLAVFFVCLCYIAARNPLSNSRFQLILLGTSAATAFLTTPRVTFLLLGVVAMMVSQSVKAHGQPDWIKHTFFRYTIPLVAFIIPWVAWVSWIGGVDDYVKMNSTPGIKEHLGISLFRAWYDNIAIGLVIVLTALGWRILTRNTLVIGFLVGFLSFSLFVKQQGPYAGMILPFVYAIIALALHNLISNNYKVLRYTVNAVIILLITMDSFLQVSKAANLYRNEPCRDHSNFYKEVISKIPSNDHVLSEFRYYFDVHRAIPNRFEVVESNEPNHILNSLQPNFILIDETRLTRATKDPEDIWLEDILKKSYQPSVRYQCGDRSLGWLGNRIAGLSYSNQSRTYRNATLYKLSQ